MTKPWYDAAFGEDYLRRYAHRSEDEACRATELLTALTGVRSDAVVFDLCCGAGRHLRCLDRQGIAGLGGDRSLPLLRAGGLTGRVLRLDMRHLPLRDGSVDVLTSFFTSFGYFPDDTENFGVLAEVARVLRPGGVFLFDFLNSTVAARHVSAAVPEEAPQPDGSTLHTRRWLTPDGRRAEKRQEVRRHGVVEHAVEESVRLFRAAELLTALESFGLRREALYGDYSGAPFVEERSPRLILLLRREGA